MAFRLSFAFCFLAALGVVLGGVHERHRRHDRMRTGNWIARANAAALSATDRESAPILVELLDDANPRVRMNARWALNQMTGMPWGDWEARCRSWWIENGRNWVRNLPVRPLFEGKFEVDIGKRNPEFFRIGEEMLGVIVHATDSGSRLDIIVHSRDATPFTFEDSPFHRPYSAFLYRRDGRIADVIETEETASAMLEARLSDSEGNRIARYWWTLLGTSVSEGSPAIFDIETASLDPGEYVVEIRMGPAILAPVGDPREISNTMRGLWSGTRKVATFRR